MIGSASAVPTDVRNRDEVGRLFEHAASQFGPVDILVNAACPGLVETEASRPWFEEMSSAQSPLRAAEDVVWLATLPPGTTSPYGELVQHRAILPWV